LARVTLLLVLALHGCDGAPDSTPDGAVRELVRLLGDDSYEPGAKERAFGLLDPGTRRELGRRARRASEAIGRKMEAPDLIVSGGTTFRWDVTKVRVVEEKVDRAVVEVAGPAGETSRVRLVREGDAWRVVLGLGGA
jgi:hypothetical protein